MGNGSGVYGLNSRIYTNSYAYQSQRTSYPKPIGYSFAGFSKPMYSSQTYHTLANNGPVADARVARFNRSQGIYNIGFNPPTNVFQV